MTTLQSRRPTVRDRSADTRRIVRQSPEIRKAERIVRRRHKELPGILAILFGHVLDRQLASGRPPASGRVVAARAEYLLSAARWELVQSWQQVLDQACRAPRARNPHAPLCRDRIIDAGGDVRTMLDVLSSRLPSRLAAWPWRACCSAMARAALQPEQPGGSADCAAGGDDYLEATPS